VVGFAYTGPRPASFIGYLLVDEAVQWIGVRLVDPLPGVFLVVPRRDPASLQVERNTPLIGFDDSLLGDGRVRENVSDLGLGNNTIPHARHFDGFQILYVTPAPPRHCARQHIRKGFMEGSILIVPTRGLILRNTPG